MTSVEVATIPLADLAEGQCHRVVAEGRELLLTRLDGIPYALDDACLHRGGSLAEAGSLRDGAVVCPLHWWRYDVRTGALLGGQGAALQTYATRVDDGGVIVVTVPPRARERSLREILIAHSRGEE